MFTRAQFASSFMIVVFISFLLWLYFIGEISMVGILSIVVLGFLFVSLSPYFYKNYWNDEE